LSFKKPLEQTLNQLSLCSLKTLDPNDETWVAGGYLISALNSFSDGLTVIENKKPIGTFGGQKFYQKLLLNPTHSFFKEQKVKDIMNPNPKMFQTENTLSEILNHWADTKFAFSIINDNEKYFPISIRNIMPIIIKSNSSQKISQIPKKEIISFDSNDTIRDVVHRMFKYGVRRLQKKGTDEFISDRSILENICMDMNYLKYSENFLDLNANVLSTEKAERVTEDLTFPRLSEKLSEKFYPFVLYQDQIITPWDVLMASKEIWKN